ncbi:MAG: UDP-N-acetylmuramoyl-L-alanyl-D-glutamate--2,6-diaminopimelate ligase [Firmicutes bacterium]|nr:UDP-N-acetylmuramoyl-L-alanyl-D-glutamate--2,6-diaminopimelate ligase [Bacillota bacterium]
MPPVTLQNLLEWLQAASLPAELRGDPLREVRGLAYDSRQVQPGDAFFCIPGLKTDGHNFAAEAIGRGAAALVVQRWIEDEPSPSPGPQSADGSAQGGFPRVQAPSQLRVADPRLALALISSRFYHVPSASLGLVGITGSNGKTTTAHMAEAILAAAGQRTGLIGTIWTKVAGKAEPAVRTTPESLDLQRLFRRMADASVTWAVMEVSSHALALQRVAGAEFDMAVLTNITRDHFDFHGDFTNYLETKLRLFFGLGAGEGPVLHPGTGGAARSSCKPLQKTAILNHDDPNATHFIRAARSHGNRLVAYSIAPLSRSSLGTYDAAVWAEAVHLHPLCSQFVACYSGFPGRRLRAGRVLIHLPVPGRFNVYNALAAMSVGLAAGVPAATIAAALRTLPPIPGRYEVIDEGQPFSVLVDFAHNPAALTNILQVPAPSPAGRRIIVFGAEGGKDQGKRPLMGEAVARHADYAILTTDNAPTEDPRAIAAQVEAGILRALEPQAALGAAAVSSGGVGPGSGAPAVDPGLPGPSRLRHYEVVLDRRQAIRQALSWAEPGDLVIIAGKGNEAFQVFADRKIPFDDRQVVRELLRHP